MPTPVWLTRIMMDAIHLDLVRQHGGLQGVRHEDALDSALARRRNKRAYRRRSDLTRLAAAYGFGCAASHPYHDGNKRIAFMAMYAFLALNGLEISAPETEVVALMQAVAAGKITERALASWVRRHVEKLRE